MSIFKFFTRRQSETLADNFASLDVGYTEYVALLTQTGTSAPVATVLNSNAPNYLGTIVWTRDGAGNYIGTATNKFNSKTICFTSVSENGEEGLTVLSNCVQSTVNTVTLRTGYLTPDENQLAQVDRSYDFGAVAGKLNITIQVYN